MKLTKNDPLCFASAPSFAVIGWALLSVLIVPTAMPGAFFWKNPGFQEQLREVGLAEIPRREVVLVRH
jgi:hypothetical protein